jgi:hypothetical protein
VWESDAKSFDDCVSQAITGKGREWKDLGGDEEH